MFSKNRWKLYEFISAFPNMHSSELSEKMNWSNRKIKRNLKRLERDGLIIARYFPKKAGELINWNEMRGVRTK